MKSVPPSARESRRWTTRSALVPVVLATMLAGVAACGTGGAEGSPAEEGTPSEAERSESPEAGQEVAAGASDDERRPMPDRAWVILGADTVVAEIARTADERAQGLKFRDELPPGTGMLFVFPDEGTRSFWMQDTYIPLDIAYIDASFRIVDIQQMAALSTETYPSASAFMYALEVPLGWFAEHGVEVGATIEVVFGG
jgi:hypothetical protein